MQPTNIREAWDSFPNKDAVADVINQQIKNVCRAVALFESQKDIIVCMGLLKAGKSTLVNLLSRNEQASPTEMGKDKTLRPALLRMAEANADACIRIYYSHQIEQEEEKFKALIDYLCGIAPHIPSDVKEQTEPFAANILEEVLCRKSNETKYLTREPLLVVVDLPHNEHGQFFCDKQRMLMDMPGCDSGHAEVTKGDKYKAIGDECAMVLLLQTTTQPLNRQAIDELQKLLHGRSESTVRIIQNRFDSKPWRTKNVVEEENNNQSSNAIRQIKEIYQGITPTGYMVNLAMATDGLFTDQSNIQDCIRLYGEEYHSKQDLWLGSGFEQMEHDLINNLSNIRETHCWDRLKNELNNLIQATTTEIQSLAQNIEKTAKEKTAWTDMLKQAPSLIQQHIQLDSKSPTISLKKTPDFDKICERTWREDNKIQTGPGMKVKGEFIDDCMKRCNTECHNHYKNTIYGNIPLNNLMINWKGTSDTVEHFIPQFLSDAVTSLKLELSSKHPHTWQKISEEHKLNKLNYQVGKLDLPTPESAKEPSYIITRQFTGKEPFCGSSTIDFLTGGLFTQSKKYDIDAQNPMFKVRILNPMAEHYREELRKNLDNNEIIKQLQTIITNATISILNTFTHCIKEQNIAPIIKKAEELKKEMTVLEQIKEQAEKQLQAITHS